MGVLLSLNYYTIQKKLFFDAKSEIFIGSPQKMTKFAINFILDKMYASRKYTYIDLFAGTSGEDGCCDRYGRQSQEFSKMFSHN